MQKYMCYNFDQEWVKMAGYWPIPFFAFLWTETKAIIIFLDFHSTKQGLLLVDSWSRGLD